MEPENSAMTISNSASGGEASVSSSGQPQQAPPPALALQQQPPAAKKKRSLPGMPDPEAEVIALSPKTLLATNRFVCEICNKGFQRDQNLQLHRRGHNLPWKLRQRAVGKEPRKRVYVCPEPSCVHHEPSRALGDLTGIKKHFCRKHGVKKWKCDKCSKKYAVQSDWKAHQKTCGTREYRCDCGTLFSRRDSFITHRAFCEALAEESAKTVPVAPPPPIKQCSAEEDANVSAGTSVEAVPPADIAAAAAIAAVAVLPLQQVVPAPAQPKLQQQEGENPTGLSQYIAPPPQLSSPMLSTTSVPSSCSNSTSSSSTSMFADIFASATNAAHCATNFSDLMGAMGRADQPLPESTSLCLATNVPASLFPTQVQPLDRRQFMPPPPSPHMSATALLQKAAQMGAAGSNSSFLKGFGFAAPSGPQEVIQDGCLQWQHQLEPPEGAPILSAGLGLGLPYEPDLMMGSSSLFGPKPTTLDFLGLGMGPLAGSANGGLSAYISSVSSGLDKGSGPSTGGPFGGRSSPGKSAWEGSEKKPSSPAIL